jgi:hypothetical protein
MSAARRAISFLSAVLATAIPTVAFAEDWRWESGKIEDKATSIVRFQTRLDLWVSTYNRPERACETSPFEDTDIATRLARLRPQQEEPPPPPGFFGCIASNSSEIGFGAGTEVSFRVISPLHVTVGIDLLYTDPSSSDIKNQIVIAVPFGILLTSYAWVLRPILQPTITPVLYVTDDARDYTLGVDFGGAWRIADWGDLSLIVGYKGAETVKSWNVQVALHPI